MMGFARAPPILHGRSWPHLVARMKRSEIRDAGPALRHSPSKTGVNALMAPCWLRSYEASIFQQRLGARHHRGRRVGDEVGDPLGLLAGGWVDVHAGLLGFGAEQRVL